MQIEYVDAGTPITNTHYIGAPKGEIYGADHGKGRFSPELNATVRPQTPLKNLYLTGESLCHVVVIHTSPLVPSKKYNPKKILHILKLSFCFVSLLVPAGQDLFLCGFAGAIAGALTCGSAILNRNLHLDTIALAKKTKYMNEKLKGE